MEQKLRKVFTKYQAQWALPNIYPLASQSVCRKLGRYPKKWLVDGAFLAEPALVVGAFAKHALSGSEPPWERSRSGPCPTWISWADSEEGSPPFHDAMSGFLGLPESLGDGSLKIQI